MACHIRAGGAIARGIRVHMVPSHSHVSEVKTPGPVAPPNRTERPRPVSNTIAAPTKPGGETAGVLRVHVVPSHSQVSEKLGPTLGPPPNNTVRARTES